MEKLHNNIIALRERERGGEEGGKRMEKNR